MTKILNSKIPEFDWAKVKAFLVDAQKYAFEKCKNQQRSKFDALSAKSQEKNDSSGSDADNIKNRWVVNFSSKTIKSPSLSLLQKGLNFAVTPKQLPMKDLIVAT